MKLIFLPADKRQTFLHIDNIILGVLVARHAQIIQKTSFSLATS